MLRTCLTSLLAAVAIAVAAAGASGWEAVDAFRQAPVAVDQRASAEKVEVAARDGYIYVTLSRPTTVKVFTILGQAVSSEQLGAGTHRLRPSSRGIYIVKVGTATHRVII